VLQKNKITSERREKYHPITFKREGNSEAEKNVSVLKPLPINKRKEGGDSSAGRELHSDARREGGEKKKVHEKKEGGAV